MAITKIQSAVAAYSATSPVTASFPNPPTNGNLMIALGVGPTVYTDGSIPGWTLATGSRHRAVGWIGLWYKIAAPGESQNVVLTWGIETTVIIEEWTGIDATPLDKIANANYDDPVLFKTSGTTASTTVSTELIIAGFAMSGNVTSATWSNSFTLEKNYGNNRFLGSRVVAVTGAYETTLSWINEVRCGGLIATFKGTMAAAASVDEDGTVAVSESVAVSLPAMQTATYYVPFDERGATPANVYENGVKLTALTSIATVDAAAGSWWYDSAVKKIYVHCTDGVDPINHTITVDFWMYFTSWQDGTTIFNGKNYLPLVAADGIPDISQEVQPYYEGTFAISSGSVSLINGLFKKYGYYFDKLFPGYFWLNRKVRILAGAEGFTYAEFRAVNTGTIYSIDISDQRFTLNLRDFRDGIHRDLPTEKYSLDVFPVMDATKAGTPRPLAFGAITDAIPVCIDTTRRVFEMINGRVKTVSLKQNGAALLENTDFFVDYQRGRFTLARALAYVTTDILLVSYTPCTNIHNDSLENGADAFRYLCNTYFGLDDSNLDLDSIYATKVSKPVSLSLYLKETANSQDIIRKIEQSIQAYSSQDEEGRIGLRAEQSAPESDAPYVWDLHVFDFESERNPDSLFSEVNVYYDEDPATGDYSLSQTLIPSMTWKHGVRKALDVYVALASSADAAAIGTAVIGIMARQIIHFSVPGILYTVNPGDVIYFSRNRFPSLSGSTTNCQIRVLGINKMISSGRTEIKAEIISIIAPPANRVTLATQTIGMTDTATVVRV